MSDINLRAFIGSSSESLNVANGIKHALAHEIDCTVWTDSFFRLSQTTIETLSAGVDKFDVGIFVFGADDLLSSRGEDFSVPRDNVVFEHGLFCGRLGPQRTFVVRPRAKALKWLSDLEGFTPAEYDEGLAKTNVDKAVETACLQILQQLRSLAPRPGIFVEGGWRPWQYDLWTYACSQPSNTVADEEGAQIFSEHNVGLTFPRVDNLNATGRFCAVRLSRPRGAGEGRFYISLRSHEERSFLSVADSHSKEGWGDPPDEFMLRLPHLEPDRYKSFVIDLEALKPFLGAPLTVTGFRLRPGLKVSHFCVCDALPLWLKDAPVLSASSAPFITIEQPTPNSIVKREELVRGTYRNVQNANAVHVFVLSPDNQWYLQPKLVVANGSWSGKAFFGTLEGGAGREYQLAALATTAGPVEDRTKQLPSALAKSIVRVTRAG
jgi:hypothetical protein